MSQDLEEQSLSNCSTRVGFEESGGYTGSDLAISIIVAYICGIATVLVLALVLRLRRQKKWCFKENDVPSPGKWEGASNPVTKKVIAKHIIKAVTEPAVTTPYADEVKVQVDETHSKPSLEEPCINTSKDLKRDNSSDTDIHQQPEYAMKTNTNETVTIDSLKVDTVYEDGRESSPKTGSLYEDDRESSSSQFADCAFQNSNFTLNEDDIEESNEHEDVTQYNGVGTTRSAASSQMNEVA